MHLCEKERETESIRGKVENCSLPVRQNHERRAGVVGYGRGKDGWRMVYTVYSRPILHLTEVGSHHFSRSRVSSS